MHATNLKGNPGKMSQTTPKHEKTLVEIDLLTRKLDDAEDETEFVGTLFERKDLIRSLFDESSEEELGYERSADLVRVRFGDRQLGTVEKSGNFYRAHSSVLSAKKQVFDSEKDAVDWLVGCSIERDAAAQKTDQ